MAQFIGGVFFLDMHNTETFLLCSRCNLEYKEICSNTLKNLRILCRRCDGILLNAKHTQILRNLFKIDKKARDKVALFLRSIGYIGVPNNRDTAREIQKDLGVPAYIKSAPQTATFERNLSFTKDKIVFLQDKKFATATQDEINKAIGQDNMTKLSISNYIYFQLLGKSFEKNIRTIEDIRAVGESRETSDFYIKEIELLDE